MKIQYVRLAGSSKDRRKAFRALQNSHTVSRYKPKGVKVLSGVRIHN